MVPEPVPVPGALLQIARKVDPSDTDTSAASGSTDVKTETTVAVTPTSRLRVATERMTSSQLMTARVRELAEEAAAGRDPSFGNMGTHRCET